MPYSRFFDEAISKLKGERRYRVFADLERDAKASPRALWHGPERSDEVVSRAGNLLRLTGNCPPCAGIARRLRPAR
jgi:5-aminolevulinate synthase